MPTSIIFATALIIGFNQVGALVSLKGTPTIVFSIIDDFLKRLLDWDGLTCGISVGTIVILLGFKKVCKRAKPRASRRQFLASTFDKPQ